MSYLIKELNIRGNKGESKLNCLFDTGAGYSFIKKEIAKKLGDVVKFPEKMEFKLADGKSSINIDEEIVLKIQINNCTISDEVLVTDNLSEDMIIGVTQCRNGE